ncbi:MAG: TIGR00645 family protein [Pirellulales bacterium]
MNSAERAIERIVFSSRWLQAPMYLGLIVGTLVYEYKFIKELLHIVHDAGTMSEEAVMLGVLTLVDMIMVANLVFMVLLGGYYIFVSRIDLDEHPDRPEWLDKTNAASLKIKLAASLVGVSGVHLLKAFINLEETHNYEVVKWQVVIHVTFLLSSLILAVSERVLYGQSHH